MPGVTIKNVSHITYLDFESLNTATVQISVFDCDLIITVGNWLSLFQPSSPSSSWVPVFGWTTTPHAFQTWLTFRVPFILPLKRTDSLSLPFIFRGKHLVDHKFHSFSHDFPHLVPFLRSFKVRGNLPTRCWRCFAFRTCARWGVVKGLRSTDGFKMFQHVFD